MAYHGVLELGAHLGNVGKTHPKKLANTSQTAPTLLILVRRQESRTSPISDTLSKYITS
jgi:hypothetical protein